MGLFDGRGALDEAGSTADLARTLGLPVVLVVDARGMARSIAPLVRGFADFDPAVRVAGVIANRVGSRRHFDAYLAAGAGAVLPGRRAAGLPRPIGGPGDPFEAPGAPDGRRVRRPGSASSRPWPTPPRRRSTSTGCSRWPGSPTCPRPGRPGPCAVRSPRIAWARDPAFCFYYEDNLDLLRDAGRRGRRRSRRWPTEPCPTGPTSSTWAAAIPRSSPSGSRPTSRCRRSIRRFHAEGGTILAECGGLMACCRELVDASGRAFPMWDLIPARVAMQPRFAALGYVTVDRRRGRRPLGPAGTTLRGHEFHYSTLEPLGPLDHATRLHPARRRARGPDGIRVGGLLAGYAHLHFGSNPEAARTCSAQGRPGLPINPGRSGSTLRDARLGCRARGRSPTRERQGGRRMSVAKHRIGGGLGPGGGRGRDPGRLGPVAGPTSRPQIRAVRDQFQGRWVATLVQAGEHRKVEARGGGGCRIEFDGKTVAFRRMIDGVDGRGTYLIDHGRARRQDRPQARRRLVDRDLSRSTADRLGPGHQRPRPSPSGWASPEPGPPPAGPGRRGRHHRLRLPAGRRPGE